KSREGSGWRTTRSGTSAATSLAPVNRARSSSRARLLGHRQRTKASTQTKRRPAAANTHRRSQERPMMISWPHGFRSTRKSSMTLCSRSSNGPLDQVLHQGHFVVVVIQGPGTPNRGLARDLGGVFVHGLAHEDRKSTRLNSSHVKI